MVLPISREVVLDVLDVLDVFVLEVLVLDLPDVLDIPVLEVLQLDVFVLDMQQLHRPRWRLRLRRDGD